jgi:hypothetical protein
MKFSDWFKIPWWFLLTASLTWLLYNKYPDLIAGHAAPVDVFFFAVWVALMLVPLFQEVSFLGVRFKQQVEELKSFVATQIGEIRSESQWIVCRHDRFQGAFYDMLILTIFAS